MIYKTYIQQLFNDGTQYTKGAVVDLLEAFHIVCQEIPFKTNIRTKNVATRSWFDEDGTDAYIQKNIKIDQNDMKVDFLYKGTEQNIRTDISNFLKFIVGRNQGAIGSELAIYNELTGTGRKNVIVKEVSDKIYFISDYDPDSIASFSVTFTVFDPVTEVIPVYNNGVVTDLSFGVESSQEEGLDPEEFD